MARPLPARRHSRTADRDDSGYGSADAPRGKAQQPLGATVGCERGPGGDPTRHDADQDEVHIEHHAFPELAECPAGPPTACRQERTECNGRRNLPARAECNARDNCQYAPSVPAPETGRHVVCGNVGRRPRFGSLPSSAACLPDVGERACLAIHRSTSATARAAAARISCRSSTAAATALSPSRHSIALTVFSESAIACSTRAKTVSTPAGSILGQRHRRRVWRGPVILAWRPLFASTGVTAICAGRWNRQLGMQAAAGRRTSRRPDAVAASRVRPGAAASARRAVGQAGAPTRGGKRGPVEVTPQTLAEMLGAPAEPNVEAAGRKRAAGRRRRAVPHGGGRRRGARRRGQPPARLRGAGPYRAPGRGHCGSRRAPRCRGCAPPPHATASTRPSSATPASSARAVGRRSPTRASRPARRWPPRWSPPSRGVGSVPTTWR